MLSRYIPKLTLSAALVLWAVFTILPLKDQPFGEFIKKEVTAKPAEFSQLMARVNERIATAKAQGREVSAFVALKQIGREDRIDLSQFFPEIKLEGSLKNIEKRNDILLNHLLKQSTSALQLGLDLKGGVSFTLEAPPPKAGAADDYQRRQQLGKAIDIIGNRINGMGVAEPVIRPVGDNRIEVQLAGLNTRDNPDVVDNVKKPAQLAFRLVQEGTGPVVEPPTSVPPGYEVLSLDEDDRVNGQSYTTYYTVKRIPEMSGATVTNAIATMDPYGSYQVHLNFNSEGSKRFADVTTVNAGRLLGIVLDGKLYSAPRINEPITGGSAQITGRFSAREAEQLANVLNNPLDLELEVKEQYEVGPSLADDAIASGKLAFIIGTGLTVAFILFFYTIGGVVAAIGMAINVLIVLGVMASIGATLTLPGIAGIVLTLAMSVDSNILIFERMREELRLGKPLFTALEAGFDKAWSAIIDGNLTTLITAVIMVILGTGAVKGFGVTLCIGIFTTMFAAVVVSKLILELLIQPGFIRRLPMVSILQDTKFDFLKWAKPAFITALVIIAVGIGAIAVKGKGVYGIDFLGGDTVALSFGQRVDVGAIRAAAKAGGFEEVTPVYQKQLGSGLELLKITTNFDRGGPLVTSLQQAFPQAQLVNEGVSRIGPSVGEQIQWTAAWSLLWALVLMLVYVAFRFEFGYGVGAVVCIIISLFATIGLFVLSGRQFNASMVAAILLVVGYGINDTIVVFDRIREELKLNPTGTLRDIVNRSLNLTLSRTIVTGGTTLLTAITLLVVTTGDVNDIALTLLIGVLISTFGSLFIATPVFYWWHKGDRKHVEAHSDIAPKYEWAGSSRASE
jgi:SecD/SecF fusion protein